MGYVLYYMLTEYRHHEAENFCGTRSSSSIKPTTAIMPTNEKRTPSEREPNIFWKIPHSNSKIKHEYFLKYNIAMLSIAFYVIRIIAAHLYQLHITHSIIIIYIKPNQHIHGVYISTSIHTHTNSPIFEHSI